MPRLHVTVSAATARKLALLAELLDTTVPRAADTMIRCGLEALRMAPDVVAAKAPPPITPDRETMGL